MNPRKSLAIRFLSLCIFISPILGFGQLAVGSSFTYQGRLLQSDAPADGVYDFEFTLWDSESAGNQIGSAVVTNSVNIVGGLFTVSLDFGADAFGSDARWLEVRVNTSARGTRGTTVLSPRTRIEAAPVSQFALESVPGNSLNAADGDPTNALYVNELGFVGVGTTVPLGLFHVEGESPAGDEPIIVLDEVFDNSGGIDGLEQAWNIEVVGPRAYVTSQVDDSLAIFDISDPENISLTGIIKDDNQTGGTGSFMNNSQGLSISGRTAYVCSLSEDTVTAIDVTNANSPSELGFIRDDGQGGTATRLNGSIALDSVGTTVYVVSVGDEALSVLDFSNALAPTELGAIANTTSGGTASGLDNPRDVWAGDGIAVVVAQDSDALTLFDVSNPGNVITQLGIIQDDSQPGGTAEALEGARAVTVVGSLAYVASFTEGALSIIDISDPTNPVELGFIKDDENGGTATLLEGARGIHVEGNLAFVVSGSDFALSVIDVTNPANPVEVDTIADDFSGGILTDFAAPIDVDGAGSRVYAITNVSDSLISLEIDVPAPSLIVRGRALKDTGPMWAMFSDQRLKESVYPLEGSLSRLLNLRPVTFKYSRQWKETFGQAAPHGRHSGFLAQEYRDVFPADVHRDPTSGYLTIDPSSTLPDIIAGIQELKSENNFLHNKTEELKKENAELKARLERLEALLTAE